MSLSQNPEPALHRITGNRIAHRFGDSQTQTTIRRPIIRLMIITHQVMHNDVFATHFAPAFKYGDRNECAYAHGNRASCDDDGCSAGTSSSYQLLLGLFGNASRCPHVSQAIPTYSDPYPQVKIRQEFSHFDTSRKSRLTSLNRHKLNHLTPKVIHKLHVCYSHLSNSNTRLGG